MTSPGSQERTAHVAGALLEVLAEHVTLSPSYDRLFIEVANPPPHQDTDGHR